MSRFSVAVFISLVCTAVLAVPELGSDRIKAPVPEPSGTVIDLGLVPVDPHAGFLPEPQTGIYDFVDSCIAKLSPICGKEIFDGLFENEDISYLCCRSLIKNGTQCHDAFVWILASLDKYKEFAPILPKRGEEVWKQCHYF